MVIVKLYQLKSSTGLGVRLSIALNAQLQFAYKVLSVKIKIKMSNSLHLSSKNSTVVVCSIHSCSAHSYSKWAADSRRISYPGASRQFTCSLNSRFGVRMMPRYFVLLTSWMTLPLWMVSSEFFWLSSIAVVSVNLLSKMVWWCCL